MYSKVFAHHCCRSA